MCAHKYDYLYPICLKLVPVRNMWLYYASSLTTWWQFFLLSVHSSLLHTNYTPSSKTFLVPKIHGELGALGDIIFILARRNWKFDLKEF